MRQNGFAGTVTAVLSVVTLVVLLVFVFQMQTVERRVQTQGGQIQDLGESADRLRSEIRQLRRLLESGAIVSSSSSRSSSSSSSSSSIPDPRWRHPEVANYLQPPTIR